MAVDLTKVVEDSRYRSFINSDQWTGTLTISGSTSGGTNTKTWDVDLGTTPDFMHIEFNGPTAFNGATDPRPSSGWFSKGQVWVRGDNGSYTNYPTKWVITTRLNGSTLTITAVWVQQFTGTLTLTSTDFSYKVIDYSVL